MIPGAATRPSMSSRAIPPLRPGAKAFRETPRGIGVADDVIQFELFDGTQMGIDYRYPLSLAWLCHRIAE